MGKRDPRVDAYIESRAEFAQPILARLREAIHAGCPEVEETVKWGMPSFTYHGILCGMAGFKNHCAFGFWKSKLILDANGNRADEAMGQFGRLTKLSELPSQKVLAGYVKKAAELNEQKVAVPKKKKAPKPELSVPADLRSALARNARARKTFEGFSPSHRREYLEWISEAKRAETRTERLKTTIQWLAEGKPRMWKYTTRAKK